VCYPIRQKQSWGVESRPRVIWSISLKRLGGSRLTSSRPKYTRQFNRAPRLLRTGDRGMRWYVGSPRLNNGLTYNVLQSIIFILTLLIELPHFLMWGKRAVGDRFCQIYFFIAAEVSTRSPLYRLIKIEAILLIGILHSISRRLGKILLFFEFGVQMRPIMV
jgi:hypothetical protein